MDSPYYQNIPDDDLQNSSPYVGVASHDLHKSDDRHLHAQKLSPSTPQYSTDLQSTVTQCSVSFYKSMHEPFADPRLQEMRPLKHTLTLEECLATLPGYDSSQPDNYATISHHLTLDTDPHSHQSTWASTHRSKLTEETPQTHNHLLLASQTINSQFNQLGKETFTTKEYTAHLHRVQSAVNSNNLAFQNPCNKDFITDGDDIAVSGNSFEMPTGECTPPYCKKYHTVKTVITGPAAQETKLVDPAFTETLLMSDDIQLSAAQETKLADPAFTETLLMSDDIQLSAAQETKLADPAFTETLLMSDDIQLSAAQETKLADPAFTKTLLMSDDIQLSAAQDKLRCGRYTTDAARETPPLMPDAEQKINGVNNNGADSAVRETLVLLPAAEDESPSAAASIGNTAVVGSTCDEIHDCQTVENNGLRADVCHDDGEKVSHYMASDDVGDKTKTPLAVCSLLVSVKDQHCKTEAASGAAITEAKPPAVLPETEGMKKILEQTGEEIILEPKAKRMKISETEEQTIVIAEDNIVVTSPDEEATTPTQRFVAATFVNVKEAIDSVPLRETDVLDDLVEDQQRSSPTKKRVATVSKRNSTVKRARVSESSSKSATHRRNSYQDDTEPEAPSVAKLKKRKTVSASPISLTDCQMTLSLTDLPPGWAEPLLYFSKEKECVKAWKSLPSRKVSTGAVYLDSECTGVPGVKDHVSGPTCILRDLCALLKAPSENLMLHERNYVSLSRANARETIKPIKANTSFSMGMTYVFRAQSERDSIQPIPMDMITFSLVKQLQAMSKHTNLFPSHIFAMEMHTWQYAPTIALHLQAMNWPKKLKSLLEMFCSPTDCDYLKTLETSYHHKLLSSRGMGGRRRGDKALSTFQTFEMGAEEKRLVNRVRDGVAKNLQNLRNTRIPFLKAETVYSENCNKGDLILQDIEVDLLTRSSAALRFRVYEYYGIPDRMVELTTDMVANDPTEITYFENLKKHLQREDERWLDTLDQANYLDFSLTKSQHEWLMSERRLRGEEPPQDINMTKDFVMLQNILVSSMNSKSPNVTIVAKMANSKFVDTCTVHKLNLSLMATRDITQGEEIQLQPNFPRVTWHDLANDDSSTEEISS